MNDQELMHYGVIGMKWGIRRAAKKGTTYQYKSHATKVYEKKAAKAAKKGKSEKAERYSKYAKKSSDLDKKMQDYAQTVSAGKAFLQLCLVNSRNYSVAKMASGNSKYVSRGLGLLADYAPIRLVGDMGTRAIYVRSDR